MCCKKPNVAK